MATAKIIVRAHAAPGYDGMFAAGRKWSENPTAYDVSDDEQDRTDDKGNLVLGTVTLGVLQRHPRMTVSVAEELAGLVGAKQALAAKDVEIAELKAALEKAEAEVAGLKAQKTKAAAK